MGSGARRPDQIVPPNLCRTACPPDDQATIAEAILALGRDRGRLDAIRRSARSHAVALIVERWINETELILARAATVALLGRRRKSLRAVSGSGGVPLTNESRIGEWAIDMDAEVAPPQTLVLIACSTRGIAEGLIEPLRQAVPESAIEVAEVGRYPGEPAAVPVARYKSLVLKAARYLRRSVWLRSLMRRIPAGVAAHVAPGA